MNTEKIVEEQMYHDFLDYIQKKQSLLKGKRQIDISDVFSLSEKAFHKMKSSDALILAAINYYDTEDIAISHAVNVAILATGLAMEMDYTDVELITIFASGLLHDIGVAKIPSRIIETSVEDLSQNEVFYFKQHPKLGYESIEKYNNRLQKMSEVIFQHHEQADGSGFPKGLKQEEIHREAQILSLIDVYESLIHPRGHRDALIPPKGIQEIIERESHRFNSKMLERLYDKYSILPEGMFVKLNSGEIGQVIKENKQNPNKPKIKILLSAEGEQLSRETIDLTQRSFLKVKKPVQRPEGII